MQAIKWYIYMPEEGDWPINYTGNSKKEARLHYLKWSGRKILPKGSKIWNENSN